MPKKKKSKLYSIAELSDIDDAKVRAKIALNKNTSPHILEILSKDTDIDVLCNVGSNPNTSETVLLELIKIKNHDLNYYIGTNPSLSPDLIHKLINKKSFVTGLIHNPNLPSNYFQKFFDSNNIDLRIELARSDYTPIDILEKLSYEDNTYIHTLLFGNKNINKIIHKFVKHKNSLIRNLVACHDNVSLDVINIFSPLRIKIHMLEKVLRPTRKVLKKYLKTFLKI